MEACSTRPAPTRHAPPKEEARGARRAGLHERRGNALAESGVQERHAYCSATESNGAHGFALWPSAAADAYGPPLGLAAPHVLTYW